MLQEISSTKIEISLATCGSKGCVNSTRDIKLRHQMSGVNASVALQI
jgi:hypothetical protein